MKEKFKDDVQLRQMAEMLADYWLKKEEICRMFQLKNTRQARLKVSEIADQLPVISSSQREGYKVATDEDDISLLERANNELESRIKALKKRQQPLKKEIARRKKMSNEKIA